MTNLQFIILPRYKLIEAKDFYCCDYVISVFDKYDNGEPTPKGIDANRHKKYYFNDVYPSKEHPDGPTEKDVEHILNLYEELPDMMETKIFLHCYAGISRSPAIAYMLHCKEYGPGREEEAIAKTALEAVYGGIQPNYHMTVMADKLLDRNGRMVEVLTEWVDKTYSDKEKDLNLF